MSDYNQKNQPGKPENSNGTKKAYDYAVYLLGLHLRTDGELRERMRQKGYKPEVIDEVIGQLVVQKFINDQQYAEIYLDNLKKYKHFGFYGIKKKLMEKRLPSEIIAGVLDDGLSIEEELKIAERFLQKNSVIARSAATKQSIGRSPRSAGASLAMTEKQKLAQKLANRGFRSEVITKLVF